jgi:hypothetical protein
MGARMRIVNVLMPVQEAILARKNRRPADDWLRRTTTRTSKLRATPL